MTTFMSPPPAATFLAFHPQDNNVIAVGMEDSTIQIYNVRIDEVVIIFRSIFSLKCKILFKLDLWVSGEVRVLDILNLSVIVYFFAGENKIKGSPKESHGTCIFSDYERFSFFWCRCTGIDFSKWSSYCDIILKHI